MNVRNRVNCRFKTLCNLHRHQECHAEEEGNKFRCQTCGRLYTSNSTLRAHSITHSNIRPHKCPHCVKTFKRNQDLKVTESNKLFSVYLSFYYSFILINILVLDRISVHIVQKHLHLPEIVFRIANECIPLK